jgi:4-amino-4-deoxy-L-arabinose transferase-like glycosyltransferase
MGLLSIVLVYAIAKKLFSRNIAIGAALYQSISSFQIYYSQEARAFALLEVFILLAGLSLWNALESSSRMQRILHFSAYAIASVLSLYTHFIAVFFLAGYGLFVVLRRTRSFVPFSISTAAALALFSPWLITMLRTASGTGQYRRFLLLKFPQAFFSFLFGDTLIPLDQQAVSHIQETLTRHAPFLLGAFLSVAVLAPYIWFAWRRWKDRLLFALICGTVPVVLAFFISFKVMMFDERYLIAASPFLYIAVAAGVAELLFRRNALRRWQYGIGVAATVTYSLMVLFLLYNYFFGSRFGREQWRDAVAYIESDVSERTLLVFDPDFIRVCYDYYERRSLPYVGTALSDGEAEMSNALLPTVAGYDSIWLIRSHHRSDTALQLFQRRFKQDKYRQFSKGDGIEAFRFRVEDTVNDRVQLQSP